MEWKQRKNKTNSGDFPPMWDWDTNPELVGELLEIKENQGPKKNSKVYSLQKEDGEIVQFWGSKMIDDNLFPDDCGTKIKIVYSGKVRLKNGNNMRQYDVFTADIQEKIAEIKQQLKKSGGTEELKPEDIPFK